MPVVTAKDGWLQARQAAAFSADPQVAFAILMNAADKIVGKPVGDREAHDRAVGLITKQAIAVGGYPNLAVAGLAHASHDRFGGRISPPIILPTTFGKAPDSAVGDNPTTLGAAWGEPGHREAFCVGLIPNRDEAPVLPARQFLFSAEPQLTQRIRDEAV